MFSALKSAKLKRNENGFSNDQRQMQQKPQARMSLILARDNIQTAQCPTQMPQSSHLIIVQWMIPDDAPPRVSFVVPQSSLDEGSKKPHKKILGKMPTQD
eukprot:Blabericola_migrator_1__1526@NODE_1400_length_4624_cov_15_837832_g936_i0_p7_GENE_NODE_1400_length_4624_cov_15_837832_g936_i0NODE_1400_length_4624_cov_15_837832_g936_i0_p7_ORF_typecomplete_len100_score13_27_NODE_1400_length_4624_cov_15_837832_g936_i025182817